MKSIELIIKAVTKGESRKSLYHFTRMRNLKSIEAFDTLYSSNVLDPRLSSERRTEYKQVEFAEQSVVINAHLRIADSVIDPSTTQSEFRTHLDQHVFFWPTLRDVQGMIRTYSRREPEESFVILKFDAYPLLLDNFKSTTLSKYDSGSSPRYPNRCSYKKSLHMFLPLEQFGSNDDRVVPNKSSEIREVLVRGQVPKLTNYLQAIYCDNQEAVPERWKDYISPFV